MDGSKRLAASLAVDMVAAMARGARPFGVAAVVLAIAGAATADVKTAPTHVVIVSKDNTALRCGDGPIYYPVKMLKAGDVLKADGEGGGWVRVEYPAGTKAYVKTDDAAFDPSTKIVKLVRASSMMAANEQGARPWWPLLSKDVGAGTVLGEGEQVKSADGVTEGYLVPAPAAARGYVRAEQVRAPTADESAKLMPAAPTAPATPVATPTTTETAAKPTGAGAQTPAPAAPATPPQSSPAEIVRVSPTPTGAGQPTTPAVTTAETPAPVTTAPPSPNLEITKRIDDVNTLRDMFDRVMQHSEDQAEVQTVISEFNRKIDALATTGDEGKIRTALEQRREALKVREEIIESRRKLAEADLSDERLRSIKLAVEAVDRQAIYTIVGRILPSTVYDGKRGTAMMYRIESADTSSSRTIGYVVPREGVDLLTKMGKVVGIMGDAKMDPALGLNIVAPSRVDELQVVSGHFEVVPGSTSPAPSISPAPIGTPPASIKPGDAQPTKEQPVATPGTDTGDVNK